MLHSNFVQDDACENEDEWTEKVETRKAEFLLVGAVWTNRSG